MGCFWYLGRSNFMLCFPFCRQQMVMVVGTSGRKTVTGEVMGVMMVVMMMTTLVILMKEMMEMRAVSLGGGQFSKRFAQIVFFFLISEIIGSYMFLLSSFLDVKNDIALGLAGF